MRFSGEGLLGFPGCGQGTKNVDPILTLAASRVEVGSAYALSQTNCQPVLSREEAAAG
jgi:hypothetical protein